MHDANERWRPIAGFEGLYEISNHGRVRSLPRKAIGQRSFPGKIMAQSNLDNYGYVQISLHRDGVRTHTRVHLLVAAAFIPNPDNHPVICHIDGNPANNHHENLRRGTQSDNMHDTVRHGRHWQVQKTHCKNGHEFTPDNIKPKNGNKHRACRTCVRIANQEYKRRKRARREVTTDV